MHDNNMLYLRYLRELLAEQDDPRAALLLDDLPEHVEHANSDWTLQSYMLDRLGELERLVSPWPGRSVYELRLVYPVEPWLAWRYHGGAQAGQPEPKFANAGEAASFFEAHDGILADLDTPDGLARASQWYVDQVQARLRDFESVPASPRPSETLKQAELRRAAFLAEKRAQFARLQAAPLFPGYGHAPATL
jgi:hypothetical protein